jgi:hypothetical protein
MKSGMIVMSLEDNPRLYCSNPAFTNREHGRRSNIYDTEDTSATFEIQ